MIVASPKCPLCRKFTFSKIHVITQCIHTKIKRDAIILRISAKQSYNNKQLLYLDGNFTTNERNEISAYIIDTMIACGPIVINRNRN